MCAKHCIWNWCSKDQEDRLTENRSQKTEEKIARSSFHLTVVRIVAAVDLMPEWGTQFAQVEQWGICTLSLGGRAAVTTWGLEMASLLAKAPTAAGPWPCTVGGQGAQTECGKSWDLRRRWKPASGAASNRKTTLWGLTLLGCCPAAVITL